MGPSGRSDDSAARATPFWAATRDYVDGFRSPPAGGFERGDHDLGYWRRMAGPHLAFLGSALGRPTT